MKYKEFIKSKYWSEYKKVARQIFNNECWFCGSKEKLNLHHTKYFKTTLGKSNKIPKNNFRWLLLICENCHKKIHEIQKSNNLEVYKATKVYRNKFFPNKRLWITKRIIKTTT